MSSPDSPESSFRISGELTVSSCGGLRDRLKDRLRDLPGDLALDLSAVTEVDAAGLQLMLWARRCARAQSHELVVAATNPAVVDALRLAGLTDLAAGTRP